MTSHALSSPIKPLLPLRGSSFPPSCSSPARKLRCRSSSQKSDQQAAVPPPPSSSSSTWPWGSGSVGLWQRPVVSFMAAAALATAPLLAWHCAPAHAESAVVEGHPRVVDGDTLELNGVRVRLFGIDAPEKAQLCTAASGAQYSCGEKAADEMRKLIGGSNVRCVTKNTDMYGRQVATCSIEGSGLEVNQWAVSSGNAVAYRAYSKQYVADEEAARSQHKGIWEGSLQEPSQWRKEHKRHQEQGPLSPQLLPPPLRAPSFQDAGAALIASLPLPGGGSHPAGCDIKGNINGQGQRIFHMPGSSSYATTQIDVQSGERWFCSPAEAEAAGWRPALRR